MVPSDEELKQKLVALLEHAYAREQVFVQSLSDEDRSATGTLERWSAKDTIAHIVAWKERAAQVLAATTHSGAAFGAEETLAVPLRILRVFPIRPRISQKRNNPCSCRVKRISFTKGRPSKTVF